MKSNTSDIDFDFIMDHIGGDATNIHTMELTSNQMLLTPTGLFPLPFQLRTNEFSILKANPLQGTIISLGLPDLILSSTVPKACKGEFCTLLQLHFNFDAICWSE